MPNPSEIGCIVIPCYRSDLKTSEQAALERCLSVLHSHPIIVAKPAKLDLTSLLFRYPALHTESFPDECFDSVRSYNRMLLSDEFYARFAKYEYMLLYQLDAFVFSDQLIDWCSQGYDFAGAPWLPGQTPPGGLRQLRARVRSKLYRLINKKDRSGTGLHHAQYDYCSGNGGFSLRRISAMRRVLHDFSGRLGPYLDYGHYSGGEDIFFCVEANRYRINVRTPGLRQAVRFAWESHPAAAARLNNHQLPFGCHGWDKLHPGEWRPIFASLGYSLDMLTNNHSLLSDRDH